MSKLLKSEAGYSLVEVIVAILILAIAIIPMVSMFDAGLRAAVLGGNYDKGRALANAKLEETRVLNYSEVVDKYPPGSSPACSTGVSGFTCEIDTTYLDGNLDPDPAARTRMQVDVTVEWSEGEYTTTGLVAAGSL